MLHDGGIHSTLGSGNLADGLSAPGFWLDSSGQASLFTPSYEFSAAGAGPNSSDSISPLIADSPNGEPFTSMPGDPPNQLVVSNAATQDAQSTHDLSTISKSDLPGQDNLAIMGQADRPTEEHLLAMDDGDAASERKLFTVGNIDSTTHAGRSTTASGEAPNQADPTAMDQVDSPKHRDLSTSMSDQGSSGHVPPNSLVQAESTRSDPIESPPEVTVLEDDSARSA
jgi:hypothetical protein